jgi:hypothetical protein
MPDTCGKGVGSATVSTSSGTAPFSYDWQTTPAQSGTTATGLTAGTYKVIVTDAAGCKDSVTATIGGTSGPSVSIASVTGDTCATGQGTAVASASGGTAPYSYTWSTTPSQTGASAAGLSGGSYDVIVSDANGCKDTATATVPALSGPTASIANTTPDTCNQGLGSATVSASGGSGSYTYSWNTTPAQTGATATNLTPGNYQAIVTDGNGCQDTASAVIGNQNAPSVSISNVVPDTCNQGVGSATATASGGAGNYSFSWNTNPAQTGATATGLQPGTYQVTVTDAGGCQAKATVNVGNANAPSVSITNVDDDTCGTGQGSMTVSASGGTQPYSFTWNTSPAQAGTTATGLSAGTYTVSVTDANGCTSQTSATVAATGSPTASIASTSADTCSGGFGAATASASGGTSPYTYTWNTSPQQTGPNATGLNAGSYTVTVQDAYGCQDTAAAVVQDAGGSTQVSLASQSPDTCGAGVGSATVSASMGTPPYTYSWNTTPAQNGATATNLSAGTYNVTAQDANGCSANLTVTVSNAQTNINGQVSNTVPDTCSAGLGSATVSPSGGQAPYSYTWNTLPAQSGPTATGLSTGNYTVTLSDQYGCSTQVSVTISDAGGPSVNVISTSVDSCNKGVGGATVTVSGGVGPYTYDWAGLPNVSGPQATGLTGGSYAITVTDANGCAGQDSFSINSTPSPNVTITNVDSITCANSTDGSAEAIAGGGTPPYSYTWDTSPIVTGSLLSGAGAGTYVVTAEDQFGCTAQDTVTLSAPSPITTSAISQPDTGGQGTGLAGVAVTGGQPPYTYQWASGGTDSIKQGLTAGQYVVTVTDAKGCSVMDTISVSDVTSRPSASSVELGLHPNPTTGRVTLTYTLPNASRVEGALYDNSGRLVQVWNFSEAQAAQHQLNLGELPAGNYQLLLESDFGRHSRRLMLTK